MMAITTTTTLTTLTTVMLTTNDEAEDYDNDADYDAYVGPRVLSLVKIVRNASQQAICNAKQSPLAQVCNYTLKSLTANWGKGP